MTSSVDQEIEAIRSVLAALEALDPEIRRNVIEYVLKRLQWVPPGSPAISQDSASGSVSTTATAPAASTIGHIKELKNKKQPRSANEMAALVAYYVAELAPQPERKSTVNTGDIRTYFKIAEFPLPKEIKMTLPNARNAGYFDPAGDGEYKLNAIGHNLVVHSMPRGATAGTTSSRKGKAR